MKIPEPAAPSYYGDEPHWQGNGMMSDSGAQYSGVSGAIPTPVYPPQIRGHMQPGYVSVAAGAYYPVYPGGAAAPPAAGPLSPPSAPPAPHVPHQHNIDFAEYMWMENEEEFDKQVMQQLEEEALMEQCIEAMLEDERERQHHHRHNGRHTNGVDGRAEVSKSTLNPLAAEFVPGGGYAPAAARAASPAATVAAAAARSPTPTRTGGEATTTAATVAVAADKEESPPEPPTSDESSADEKPGEPRPQTPEATAVAKPEPPAAVEERERPPAEKVAEVSAAGQPDEEKPAPEAEAHAPPARREAPPQPRSRRKPTMAEMVGGRKGERSPVAPRPAREPESVRSEPRIAGAAPKGKDIKQVKSEPRVEPKSKEASHTNSILDKPAKEEHFPAKLTPHQSSDAPTAAANHVALPPPPKPINYAAAAKAKAPPRTQPAAQAPPQAKKPAK